MSAIRFPASAVPLLPLCKGHGENYIFRTYADLIGFTAAYGFFLVTQEGHKLPAKPIFTDNPNAISLDVFENRGLYPNLLVIALAHENTCDIAEDEDLLVKLIEQYTAAGAASLSGSASMPSIAAILEKITSRHQGESSRIQI